MHVSLDLEPVFSIELTDNEAWNLKKILEYYCSNREETEFLPDFSQTFQARRVFASELASMLEDVREGT